MGMFSKKKVELPSKPKLKTMDELVTSFTSEAQTIADAQADIVRQKEEEIRKATEKRDAASKEQRKANVFIKNFTALADDPEEDQEPLAEEVDEMMQEAGEK
jgi:hypothetical protein